MKPIAERLAPWRETLLWGTVVGAGVLAAWGMRLYLEQRAASAQQRLEQRFHPRPVVVARTNLAPGTLLDATDLAVRAMPADYLPSSAVLPDQVAQLRGRVLEHALAAGEAVQTALLRPLAEVHLAERVPLGRRAVTIAVDETNALAGLLRPGDRIDVHWREDDGGQQRGLANLEVLAVGDQVGDLGRGGRDERFATVTLQVDPEQARLLGGAGARVAVSLRNPRDAEPPARTAAVARPASTPGIALIVGGQGGPVPALRRLLAGAP